MWLTFTLFRYQVTYYYGTTACGNYLLDVDLFLSSTFKNARVCLLKHKLVLRRSESFDLK